METKVMKKCLQNANQKQVSKRIYSTREFHRGVSRPNIAFCCWDIWISSFCCHKHKWLLERKFPLGGVMRTFQNLKSRVGTFHNQKTKNWLVLIFLPVTPFLQFYWLDYFIRHYPIPKMLICRFRCIPYRLRYW